VAEHPAGARRNGWFGAVVAVGVLLIVLGAWNLVDGVAVLVTGGFVAADAERVLVLGPGVWGWVLLVVGAVEAAAGVAMFIGARWARVVAVVVAAANGLVQLAFLAAYPVGAILIMLGCAAVIAIVVRHGDSARV